MRRLLPRLFMARHRCHLVVVAGITLLLFLGVYYRGPIRQQFQAAPNELKWKGFGRYVKGIQEDEAQYWKLRRFFENPGTRPKGATPMNFDPYPKPELDPHYKGVMMDIPTRKRQYGSTTKRPRTTTRKFARLNTNRFTNGMKAVIGVTPSYRGYQTPLNGSIKYSSGRSRTGDKSLSVIRKRDKYIPRKPGGDIRNSRANDLRNSRSQNYTRTRSQPSPAGSRHASDNQKVHLPNKETVPYNKYNRSTGKRDQREFSKYSGRSTGGVRGQNRVIGKNSSVSYGIKKDLGLKKYNITKAGSKSGKFSSKQSTVSMTTTPTLPPWDGKMMSCDDFFLKIRFQESRSSLLCMYDPGNCTLVSNSHKPFLDAVDTDMNEMIGKWGFHELWDYCQNPAYTHGTGRLCDGMPSVLHRNNFLQRYVIDPLAYIRAQEELGDQCFYSKVSIYMLAVDSEHQGGPRKVINNLLSGLRTIGKVYYLNGHDLQHYDYKVMLGPSHHFLLYHLNETHKPGSFFLGPTIAAYQFRTERITNASRDHVHLVGASKYALSKQDQYVPAMPMRQVNTVVIPTAIDTEFFKPNKSYVSRPPRVSLFYFKRGCNTYLFSQLREEVVRRRVAIVEISYGGYTELEFRDTLQNVKFAVFCDGPETQGIAGQEIMSMDVPVFITDPYSAPYFHPKVGMVYTPDSPLPEQIDEFWNRVRLGEYSPRKYMEENFGLVPSAINFMKTLCGQKTQWN